jgi:hypothetical protein
MKEIRNFLSRFRLLGSLLALGVLLSALAVTPTRAFDECDTGCINWTKAEGCLDCQTCCVGNGQVTCSHDTTNRDCGTSGWIN